MGRDLDNGAGTDATSIPGLEVAWRIRLARIQPGLPSQNATVESFPGHLRDEFQNANWFWNLWDARKKMAAWRLEVYIRERSQSVSLSCLISDHFEALSFTNIAGRSMRSIHKKDAGQEASIVSFLPCASIPAPCFGENQAEVEREYPAQIAEAARFAQALAPIQRIDHSFISSFLLNLSNPSKP